MNAWKLINYSKYMSTVDYVTFTKQTGQRKSFFGSSSQAALTINYLL